MTESQPTGDPKKVDAHLRALKTIFRPERILSTDMRVENQELIQQVQFPAFDKPARPIDHASHVQINEALLEGLYAIMAGLRFGTIEADSEFVDVLKIDHTARIVGQNVQFEQEIGVGEIAEFHYQITSVEKEEDGDKFRFRVTVDVQGPSNATFVCLVTPKQIHRDR